MKLVFQYDLSFKTKVYPLAGKRREWDNLLNLLKSLRRMQNMKACAKINMKISTIENRVDVDNASKSTFCIV